MGFTGTMNSLYKTGSNNSVEGIMPITGHNRDAMLEVLSEKTVVQVQPDVAIEPLRSGGPSDFLNQSNQRAVVEEHTVVLDAERHSRDSAYMPEPATQISEPNKLDENPESSHSAMHRRVVNENMLVSCAMPLIHHAMNLASMVEPADISSIRSGLISDIGRFQNKAEQCTSDQRHIVAARYLLCSFVDEVIATTPWGVSHRWGAESLLSYYHNETYGGDGFFTLLERAMHQPQQYLDLLELMYVCLSLGFSGRYRVDKNGTTKLESIRESMMTTIANHQAPDNRGMVVGEIHRQPVNKKRAAWLAPVIIATLLIANAAGYLIFSNQIEARMDTASEYILSGIANSR